MKTQATDRAAAPAASTGACCLLPRPCRRTGRQRPGYELGPAAPRLPRLRWDGHNRRGRLRRRSGACPGSANATASEAPGEGGGSLPPARQDARRVSAWMGTCSWGAQNPAPSPLFSSRPRAVPAERSAASPARSPFSLGGGLGGPSAFLSVLCCPSSSSSPSGNSHCDSPECSLT